MEHDSPIAVHPREPEAPTTAFGEPPPPPPAWARGLPADQIGRAHV